MFAQGAIIKMSGNIPELQKKILGWRCGNRCAISECRKELIIDRTEYDNESIIGEMAHIKGEKQGSARYDSNMTDVERNSHQNLLILCRDHHKMIDDQPNTYTIEKLYKIKNLHESWIKESTAKQIMDITFAELNIITKYLVSNKPIPSDSFTIISPRDKIKKNGLSSEIERLITMGITQVKQVTDFIDKIPDIEFGDRLKQGFVVEYERLRNENKIAGDDLFYGLFDFASGKSNDFKVRAAGLAVLVYLFEACEVFEK